MPSSRCIDQIPEDRQFALPDWPRTNFCRHGVPFAEIFSGGVPRDRIPAIDHPNYWTIEQADIFLEDVEPVIALRHGGRARAYPLQVMVWHEIVNDTLGGEAVAMTYCPLCNSALAFNRTVGGQTLDFATTGNLRHADLIMYDRQTESWWQQFTGEAIVGDLTGHTLEMLPAMIVSWADFKSEFPQGDVLSADTGHERLYGQTPYINYDSLVNPNARYLQAEPDPRLPPKMRVLAVSLGEIAIAYPYSVLSEAGVVHDSVDDQAVVVFWKSGTTSALYKPEIAASKDVGSAAAYSRVLNGQALTFAAAGNSFVDAETGSTWNLFGAATAGPLKGQHLRSIPSHEFLWFAWAAFRPDTRLYAPP